MSEYMKDEDYHEAQEQIQTLTEELQACENIQETHNQTKTQ